MQLSGDLFIGESLEHALQNSTLARVESLSSSMLLGPPGCAGDHRTHRPRVQPGFARTHLVNSLHKLARWTVLEKDPGRSAFERAQGGCVAHSRGNHQDSATKSSFL